MAEKLDPKQTVDFKELLISEVIQTEALTNLLEQKGIISKEELLEDYPAKSRSRSKAII